MTTIQKNDFVFNVDFEKTKEYYETHSLCDCVCCKNYYAQIKEKLPNLTEFLNEFGADISKPDEALSTEMEDYIDYLSVDYTICGNIHSIGQSEIRIEDSLNIEIIDGFSSPNEQTGEYFTISVMNIKLPWVLDEPFPKPMRLEKNKKIKKIFKK
ncbi:MAG: hypothetical protein K2K42_02770 [Eubacterium sp.]|nr:hypothetical protein [Eubacterium sp.]